MLLCPRTLSRLAQAAVLAAALSAVPALAQDWQADVKPGELSPEDARKRLEVEQKDLEASRQKESDLEQSLEQLAEERQQLSKRLVETARKIQEHEAELTRTEERLARLKAEESEQRRVLKLQQRTMIRLLAALQRMGRNPPPVLITERDDALKMVRSAMQLASVFPQLRDEAVRLAKQLGELDRTVAEVSEQSLLLAGEARRLADEQQRLDGLLQAKQKELASSRDDLERLRKEVMVQAQSVANLTELIDKSDHALAMAGTLATTDKEIQEARLEPQPEPPAPGAAPLPPPSDLLPKADRARLAFSKLKGSLALPVSGTRVLAFGDPTKNVGRSKGEAYATRPGAQITTPCGGEVVYAGEFRSYGQLLIIKASEGYHVLLAGLGQIDVTVGQSLVAGEPVGKMRQAPPAGASGPAPASAVLYVEFRNREKAINPAPWWSSEAQKVQG